MIDMPVQALKVGGIEQQPLFLLEQSSRKHTGARSQYMSEASRRREMT